MRILLAGATFFTGVLQTFADPLLPSATAADTTHAIQAAIDAAGSGGTVTLGAGTFEIDAQLMVTNGVTLQGQGWDSTIIKQTASGQRVATLDGGASLIGVTATGARLNAGWTHGAGLLVDDGTVSWCCVSNNVNIGRNVHGGGVNITKGTIDHCIVAFNQAGTYTSSGGGIGTYNTSGTFVIDTCLVHGNTASVTDTAGKGGGICVNMGNPSVTIRNTTIAGNSSSGSGGGFYNGSYGNKVKLVNTLVAGNSSDSEADSHDGTLASGSSNNLLGVDPSFVDPSNGDFHLAFGSPAINAGATYTGIDRDLDNVTFANPPAVGCYEYGERVADPEFAPAPGSTFYPTASVTLSCATEGTSIYYTTDGSVPTDSSTPYMAPIALSATTTIRARAYATGKGPSAIVSATYTFKRPVPKPDQFRKSVEITLVTNLSSTAITTGIPALVRLDKSTIVGFHYDDFTLTNGGDMMFVDENGEALPHEVDTWDTSGESLVWVKLPSTAANTKLTMYYGNGTVSPAEAMDVWGDYVGVWHLNEANGNARDSTGHGLVAVPTGADAADSIGVAAKIGNGRQMATAKGKKSYLSVANSDLLDCGDSLTFSGWFKASATFANYSMRYVSRKNAYTDANGWEVEARYGTDAVSATTVSARGASQGDFTATVPDVRNNWIHLVLVFNGKTLTYYVNGIQKASHTITAACSDNDLALVFGNSPTGNESNWCGWMDELRLSDDPMSPEYAGAQYAAMNVSATDIFAYGAATSTQSAGAVISVR